MSEETINGEESNNKTISRRGLLGGGALVGAGAVGLGLWSSDRDTYLTDVDRSWTEQAAKNQRNRVEQASEDFEETNKSIGLPKDIEEYNDRGHIVEDGFLLRKVDSDNPETYNIPREQDGESVEYVFFEHPDIDLEELSLANVVDRSGNEISDIALSHRLEGRIKSEIEDFQNIVPYLQSGDNSPNVSEENLDNVEELKEELDSTIEGSYLTLISELEDVSTTSGSVIENELETSERETVTTVGNFMLSGDGYRRDNHFTEDEAEDLVSGTGQYEDRGLSETKDLAEDMIQEVAAETVKTAIISDTLGRALETAGRTSDFYFDHSNEIYAGVELDGSTEEEIQSYAEEHSKDIEDLDYAVKIGEDNQMTLRYGTDIAGGEYEEMILDEE